MLSSYIVDVQSQGHDNLKDRIPSIFEIQDHIEMAWDLGINKQGRTETGGIRGTRKYIGTSDVITSSHFPIVSNTILGSGNVL
jgi:hypothetical protein